MTTAKPDSAFERLLAFLLPPPASPAEQRARDAFTDAIRDVRNRLAHGRIDRATALRAASDILDALANHVDAVPPVLPLSAHGATTVTGSASLVVTATVEAKATVYTPTVRILTDEGHAEDTLTVEKLPIAGLSHKQKLLLLRLQVFLVVFFALYGVFSAHEDEADRVTLYTGGGAVPMALWCASQVGRAYDKKYGPDNDAGD
ncbi:hypothetical protein [Nonomuraea sp. NPDC005650]|uniref:hypothetical protein n=1 Tax=Nonomuraea sp. NPDC005650 TaxID=3157045 RepID=UPI0033BC6E84